MGQPPPWADGMSDISEATPSDEDEVVVVVDGVRLRRVPALLPIATARKLMLRDYRGVIDECGPESKQALACAELRAAKAELQRRAKMAEEGAESEEGEEGEEAQ